MSFRKKRVLITGITGFAGSYLANHLVRQGADVYGLFRRRADGICPNNIRYFGIANRITLCESDLLDISGIASAIDRSRPDYIFHLGAQSFVHRSFACPTETMDINCSGTGHILDVVKSKGIDPVIIYAGSSEEYGLVIYSQQQYKTLENKYGVIFPAPVKIPEIPVTEENPLRPMSPYAVSKVYGDYLMRNYCHSYGLKTVVSRGFNHEGAGRGTNFVTSVITSQVMRLVMEEADKIRIGNVNAFRDWSHVSDVIDGYLLLAEKGRHGDVYNQGSMRTNSVLSYILLSLEAAGYPLERIETFRGEKAVIGPTEPDRSEIFGLRFTKTKIDGMILRGEVEFGAEDGGVVAHSGSERIAIEFDPERFRPAEVPILLSDTAKIEDIGFSAKRSLSNIIEDQLNHYLSEEERKACF